MDENRSDSKQLGIFVRPGRLLNLHSWGFWIGLTFVLILILHLWSLTRYPGVSDDEAWLVSRAWAFIQTGHQLGPLDDPGFQSSPGLWTVNQWLITFLQAGVLRFFSAPSLIALRVLSLVFGLGLLGTNFWIAYRLSGKWLAVISTLLLALSRSFFYSAHQVRYDILAAFFCYLSLAIVINNRRGRFLISLAAGAILGLAIETHLNSLIFIPTIGVYLLLEYGRKVFSRAAFWGFASGLGFGAIYYLVLHILPFPATYFNTTSLVFGQTLVPPILSLSAGKILQSFLDTGNLLLVAAGPLLIMIVIAVIFIFRRRTKPELQMLAINLTLVVSAALVIPLKNGHYAILLAPAIIWLAGIGLKKIFAWRTKQSLLRYTTRALTLGVAIGAIALSLVPLQDNGFKYYQNAQAAVNSVVKVGDSIIGPQAYWLGLYEYKYYSWENLFFYPRQVNGATLADAFAYYRPKLMIIDAELNKLIVDNVDPASQWYYNHLSRTELTAYLRDNAQLVSEPENGTGSGILVYRLYWEK